MPGPQPKNPRTRQRRHRKATAAELPPSSAGGRPQLPRRQDGTGPWERTVLAWWETIWSDPMSGRWRVSDVPGLVDIARLRQELPRATGLHLIALTGRIASLERRYGLDPMSRASLGWGEAAPAGSGAPARPRRKRDDGADPRLALVQ